ncbi:MAG: YlxR family protein [Acidimicrobiia bacterium]
MRPQVRRHSPERTCIGCRRKGPVTGLVRIHLGPGGPEPGPGPGRGAWLCADHPVTCLEEAVRRKQLDRALRRTVPLGDVERLRARLEDG